MKKTKIEHRIKKAFNAFFENEDDTASNQFEMDVFTGNSLQKKEKTLAESLWNILSLVKQMCFFLPGAFFTFYIWLGITVFGFPSGRRPILFFLILLLSPLSMVIGLGDVKNLKHWIMPLSVGVLGVFIGILINTTGLTGFIRNFGNAIYLFPLALIVAVLSKNWVDSLDPNDSN